MWSDQRQLFGRRTFPAPANHRWSMGFSGGFCRTTALNEWIRFHWVQVFCAQVQILRTAMYTPGTRPHARQ